MEGLQLADEQKDYEVVDKRKVRLNEQGEPELTEEATRDKAQKQGSEQHPQSEAAQEEPPIEPIDAESLIKSFISMLSVHAWQWLGLVKNPITGQIEKDLAQAKLAIDTMAALISCVESRLEPAERTEMQTVLSNLRLNFVKQSQ